MFKMKNYSFLVLLLLSLTACSSPVEESATDSASDTAMEMGEGEMDHDEMDMDHSDMEMDGMSMQVGDLTIAHVRANMTLPTDTGSLWMSITNNSDSDEILLGAEVPGCGLVELHDMFMNDDVMVMQPVDGQQILIPAGQTVELKQGGLHIMCLQKEAPLEEGSSLDITLNFQNAGLVSLTSSVVAPGEMHMDHSE